MSTALATVAPIARRPSAADACAADLRGRILAGELPPEARLPPERELAAAFGVNRLTLRSALAQLAAVGLLRVRQGSGYVVQDFRREGGTDLLPGLVELATRPEAQREVAADLLLVRRQLAIAVLERLATRADAEGVARIEEAVARYAALAQTEPTPEHLAEADLELLRVIVEATGSAVLQLCLNPVGVALRRMPALRDAIYGDAIGAAAGYQALLGWLRTRDVALVPMVAAELARRDAETLDRLGSGRGKKARAASGVGSGAGAGTGAGAGAKRRGGAKGAKRARRQ